MAFFTKTISNPNMNKNNKKIFLIILAIIVAIALIFLAINNLFGKTNIGKNAATDINSKGTAIKTTRIIEGEAISLLKVLPSDIPLGDKNAPVTIIEYASLSCGHCALFHSNGFPKLNEQYIATGKVKFIYRDFPLNQPALVAGMVAHCQVNDREADTIKYYDFIKVLFKTQETWAFADNFTAKLQTIAKLDGMSAQKFNECISNKTTQETMLKARLQASQILQISSTPTLIIDGEVLSGYTGYYDIQDVIDRKLVEVSNKPAANLEK